MNVADDCRAIEDRVRAAGHPVAELLRRSGVTTSQWQRYKAGIYVPKVTTWARITSAADEIATPPEKAA